MTRRTALGLATALLLLAACGGILPTPPPPPRLYRLTPLTGASAAAPTIAAQLVIATPNAPSGLDTERIALARSPISIDFFAGAAWTDRVPLMLQTLIVESLENAGQIRVVARQSPDLRADAILSTDLHHFEAVYGGDGAPETRIALDCRIIRAADRTVIAVKSFAGTARAAENEMPAIVAAFDDAFHAVMHEIALWTAASLGSLGR